MSFTSPIFFCFFAALILVYYLTPKKWRWIVLLVASIAFYAFFSLKFFIFIGFTTISIYLCALYMSHINKKQKEYFLAQESTPQQKKQIKAQNKKKKKLMLLLGILSNVAVLVTMKYLNFLILNFNAIVGWFSDFSISPVNIFLPLGISFYIFQSIGYLVDVYWGKYQAEKNFAKFALFITFFPKIMQGPIIRYDEMQQELLGEHSFDYRTFTDGLKRFGYGLLKKMVIADCLAVFIEFAFSNVSSLSGFEGLIAVIFYMIQDYCDFSGYMDIAIGISMCLGIKLPENFRRPYFSRSVEEYWRRWHITLGTWFKDYIFYPLSMSKFSIKLGKLSKKVSKRIGKFVPAIFGLIVVWFVTGLWHGASWTYVLWGLYYGVIIILGIIFEGLFKRIHKLLRINTQNVFYKIFQHIRTIFILCVGRILFRAPSLGDAFAMIKKPFSHHKWMSASNINNLIGVPSVILVCFIFLFVIMTIDIIQEKRPETSFCDKLAKRHICIRWSLYILLIVAIIWFGFYGSGMPTFEFGYVQF